LTAVGLAAILGGVGTVISSVALLVGVLRVSRTVLEVHQKVDRVDHKVDQVSQDVATANGIPLGELAERIEGRRVAADIPRAVRTASEQGYVERLDT
jgi:hypothetical protein